MKSFWNKIKPWAITATVAFVGIVVIKWALSKFAPKVKGQISILENGGNPFMNYDA